MSHCCTGCSAAGCPMALALQDSVDVDVIFSVCVTQVELQHAADVKIRNTHQGAITAQFLERSNGLSSPTSLQEFNHKDNQDNNTHSHSDSASMLNIRAVSMRSEHCCYTQHKHVHGPTAKYHHLRTRPCQPSSPAPQCFTMCF